MNIDHKPRVSPGCTQSTGEELANSISHGVGLCAGLIGAPILLSAATHRGTGFFVGTIVFTMTMSMLYLGSTLYHAWPHERGKSILQVLDHSAIFLLIAGTYTPFALGPLGGSGGMAMLGAVWALAIFGVILKATRGTSRHRKLAMSLYLGTGWLGVIVIRPLALAIPMPTLVWLLTGGIAYTVGVLFYVNERRSYNHFVWHLFVLGGTSCHFLALFSYAA